MFKTFSFLTAFLLIITSFALAQEQITITTYYPSPYGVYRTLRLYPSTLANEGDLCNNEGEMFYHQIDHTLYVCSNGEWQAAPGEGASGFWEVDPGNPNDIRNTNPEDVSVLHNLWVSGDMGVGTASANAKLDVNGGVKIGYTGANCNNANKRGIVRYNTTVTPNRFEYCDGSAWQPLGTARQALYGSCAEFQSCNSVGCSTPSCSNMAFPIAIAPAQCNLTVPGDIMSGRCVCPGGYSLLTTGTSSTYGDIGTVEPQYGLATLTTYYSCYKN